MENTINKRNWWIVLVVAAILALAVTLIQQKWLPDYDFFAFLIIFLILGLAFYWVYTIDKEKLWWALIPALAMVVILVTGIVAYLTPKDASNSSPYGVVAMGLGVTVMGLILKRPMVKFVMYVIAMIVLLVGILMLPLNTLWTIVLIVLEILLLGALAWRTQRKT
jgi:hypothetical protein